VIDGCLGTKFVTRWGKLMTNLALDAVLTVMRDVDGQREIDFKRYARIEKIPGGEIEECRVLDGILINKDLPHPKMRRIIENPRIILLDSYVRLCLSACPLFVCVLFCVWGDDDYVEADTFYDVSNLILHR